MSVVDRGGVNVSERRQDQQQRAGRRVCGLMTKGMSVFNIIHIIIIIIITTHGIIVVDIEESF